MRRSRVLAAVGAALCIPFAGAAVAAPAGAGPAAPGLATAAEHAPWIHSCTPQPGLANCHALLLTSALAPAAKGGNPGKGKPTPPPPTGTPSGYGPSGLQSAYNLTSVSGTAGSGKTVAIVDAYDDPNAESDLAVYRSQFGLPACTTGNGCFTKVDQNGGKHYPRANGGWAQEISLDLDMVSAICPNCHILLVEASSASMSSLGTAVNTAATWPGVTAISNSYGAGESSYDTTYDSAYFNHHGVAITASTGDSGYGVEYPAASQYVTAVGGTSLSRDSSARGWSETAWSGAGSGCSAYDSQPSWQGGVVTASCSNRAVADVSADADPATGVAVYDSYSYQGYSGWLVFGGTSVASPIVASVYALAGGIASDQYGPSYLYSHSGSLNLNDVTSGSNGSCGGSSLCTAGTGWDGPTGLGTPNGTSAF